MIHQVHIASSICGISIMEVYSSGLLCWSKALKGTERKYKIELRYFHPLASITSQTNLLIQHFLFQLRFYWRNFFSSISMLNGAAWMKSLIEQLVCSVIFHLLKNKLNLSPWFLPRATGREKESESIDSVTAQVEGNKRINCFFITTSKMKCVRNFHFQRDQLVRVTGRVKC